MELNFRNAVILSMIIHGAAMLSLYGSPVFKDERIKRDNIVVDYIPSEEPKMVEAAKQEMIAAPLATPKVDLLPEVDMRPAAPASAGLKDAQQKQASEALARKQAQIKSTKDYINYYQLIRERIRRNLQDRYRDVPGEGDIGLIFVLRSDGALISCEIDKAASADDRALRAIALTSLKAASPFQPFPKVISLPNMAFTVTITFKRE